MTVLQTIKGVLSRYFPLHTNETVVALNDDLADAELELYFSKARADHHSERAAKALALNGDLLRENSYLSSNLEQARQHIRVVQQELDDIYKSMTPQLSRWPMPISAQLDDSGLYGSVIRVELPPLRLACMVNEAVRRGLYKGYADAFADQLAQTAQKEVREAVIDILNSTLPIKK